MKTKIFILIFSLVGFSFSLYLYLNGQDSLLCTFNGCDLVLRSKFNKTLGVDNSILGILYFLTIGVLTYFNKEKILKILSTLGAIFALYLLFVMFFVLKEICPFCLIVDLIAIIIFVLIYDFQGKSILRLK